jgi:hypothetical protein
MCVLLEDIDPKCHRCEKCGIVDFKQFIESAVPVDVFKAAANFDSIFAVRLYNRVSEDIQQLLYLKTQTVRDMLFAKEKFSLQTYSAVEYVGNVIQQAYLRVGLWLKDLVSSNVLCPHIGLILSRAADAIFKAIEGGVKEICNGVLEGEVSLLWGWVKEQAKDRLEVIREPQGVYDYYHVTGTFFLSLYEVFDRFCYLITSYTSVVSGDKVIYAHRCWKPHLREFVKVFAGLANNQINRICVISRELVYDVNSIVQELKLNTIIC